MKKLFLILLVIFLAYYIAFITSGASEKRPVFSFGTSSFFYKISCLISGETDTTDANSVYSRAQVNFQMQSYTMAIADYKKAIALNPAFSAAYYELANTYLAAKDTVSAIDLLKNYVLKADYPDVVYIQLGEIFQKKNMTDSCKFYFSKAIEKNSDNQNVYYKLSALYFNDSIFDKALDYINQAISRNEAELEYRNFRRIIYLKMNKQQEADQDYQYIVSNNPSYFGKYQEYAKNAYDSGQYRTAVEYYKLALADKPNDRVMLENRAWSYYQISELDSSYMDYLLVSKLEPDYLSFFNVAYILDIQGKPKESIEFYNKSIKLKDDYYIAYNNRGYEYYRLKKYKEAEKDYTKSISLKPDYYLSNYNRGLLYAAQNKHEKAIKDYRNALEGENMAAIHYDIALSYDKLKDKSQTIESFNEYLKLADQTDSIRVNYAKKRIAELSK